MVRELNERASDSDLEEKKVADDVSHTEERFLIAAIQQQVHFTPSGTSLRKTRLSCSLLVASISPNRERDHGPLWTSG